MLQSFPQQLLARVQRWLEPAVPAASEGQGEQLLAGASLAQLVTWRAGSALCDQGMQASAASQNKALRAT